MSGANSTGTHQPAWAAFQSTASRYVTSHPRVGSSSAQRSRKGEQDKAGHHLGDSFVPLSGLCFPQLGAREVSGRMCFVTQETAEFGGNTTFTPCFEHSFLALQILSSRACCCISEMAVLANTSGISVGPLACLRLMYINACSTSQNPAVH